MHLDLPSIIDYRHRSVLHDVADRLSTRHGDDLLGLVLSGSAGRGMATERSDLDLLVILTPEVVADPSVSWIRSAELEEIPLTVEHLETVAPFGSSDHAYRWSYGWAPVLLDRTAGRIRTAVDRQTRMSTEEILDVLIGHERLGFWLNLTFRALKSARARQPREARLDAAEALPAFLDIVFALHGLVRPYNTYLPWALTHHPLPGWDSAELITLIDGMLAGDVGALRAGVAKVHDHALRLAADLDHPPIVDAFREWYDGDYGAVLGLPTTSTSA